MKFLFFDEVSMDLSDARQWYKEQKEGLEEEFSEEIKKALLKIRRYPFGHSIRYRNIRIAHLERFPYNIHFYIDEALSQIVITAIVHKKRHPRAAKRRSR
jgi:plasmid stabilization system protein ParE